MRRLDTISKAVSRASLNKLGFYPRTLEQIEFNIYATARIINKEAKEVASRFGIPRGQVLLISNSAVFECSREELYSFKYR